MWQPIFRHAGPTSRGRRCPRLGRVVAVLLFALFLPDRSPAAQDDQSKWTLQRLVSTAIDRNPGLAASKEGITVAEEDINAARGEQFPRLDAVGLGEFFPRRERLLIFRHGFREDDNPFETAIVSYGLELTLPLYTSGRIEHGIALSEARAAASRSRVQLTRNQLIFNVASAYYTVLRLQQVIIAQDWGLVLISDFEIRISNLPGEWPVVCSFTSG